MAASQARLLTITARIHDVEYQAQAIENAKIQLSTLSDQAYSDYLAALDATTMTLTAIDVNSGNKSTVAATFNNLCSRNKLTSADGNQYALRDKNGKLIVEEDIAEGYLEFQDLGVEETADHFALFMMGVDNDKPDNRDYAEAEEKIYNLYKDESGNESLSELRDKLLNLRLNPSDIDNNDADLYNYEDDYVAPENQKEYKETLSQYLNLLYSKYSSEISNEINNAKGNPQDEIDTDLYNYYVSIYKQIQSCGGCVSIKDFDGPSGDAANNTEWLQAMVQAGIISISTIENNGDGSIKLNGTSPSSDISLNYTETTSIDKTALAKAEAQYEYSLKQIDKKDKQYDLSLSKLESERTALTTEYASVKKVIEDNIERTFGIFS